MSRSSLLLVALLLFVARLLPAQTIARAEDTPPPTAESRFTPNVSPTLVLHRTSGPITIDGRLDEAAWADAAHAENFTEVYPNELGRPRVATSAMVTYDDRNLYIGFIAKDDPSTIRASLHDRDEQWNEDYCGFILDTYGNASWAYEIFVNALGVQGDLLWPSNADEDTKFDMVFDARSQITEDGYRVEIAIPFSSLRFPDAPSQVWKGTFWRIHPRESRMEYSWAAIDRNNPCEFCQYGTILGIENVHPGGSLELLPAVVASSAGTREEPGVPSSPFTYTPVSTNLSLGARYAFTPSVTAEMTINPDFSQVESDATQIDVNSTFAISYPERRPFFQEGSDLFSGWINSVYTRSINAPKVAAKLIGRMGSTSLAYLGAWDEQSPIIIPDEERSYFVHGGRSLSTVARARKAIGESSYIGALVTDRRFEGGGSGTQMSIDALYRFLGNYQLEMQTAFSLTAEPNAPELTADYDSVTFDRGRHTIALDGEKYAGNAIYASVERHARDWNFDFDYWETSPTFRAYNGFITRDNRREGDLWAGYTIYPSSSFIDRIEPSASIGRVWNYDGLRKDEWIVPAISFNFKAQTWVKLAYVLSNERFKGYDMDGISRLEMNVNSNFSQPVSLGMDLTVGRSIARSLDVPVLGRGIDINAFGTFKLFERLNIQPSLAYSRMAYPDSAAVIYDGFIARAKVSYQFSRELFLRLVVQYDDFSRALSVEPLVTYKLNPFTIFYAGSTHLLDDDPERDRFNGVLGQQQFFVKGQYLVQI